tara:strand:- start:247 stop:456 length:210 start_codon:yes stop_codon:yes gene_type:complete
MKSNSMEKKYQQRQKEREEMWESLGMNWKEGSCLPKAKERATTTFVMKLIKTRVMESKCYIEVIAKLIK